MSSVSYFRDTTFLIIMKYDNLVTQLCCNPNFKLTIEGIEVTDENWRDFSEKKMTSLLSNVLSDVVSQRWFNPMDYMIGYSESGRVFTEDTKVILDKAHLFQACAELYELSWFRKLSDSYDILELKKELNSYVSDPHEFVPPLYSASNLHLRFNETQFFRAIPSDNNPQGRTFRPYGGRIRNSLHFMLMSGFVDFDGTIPLTDFDDDIVYETPIRTVSTHQILRSPVFKQGVSNISRLLSSYALPALYFLDDSKPVVNKFIFGVLTKLNVHCDPFGSLDKAVFTSTGLVLGGSGETYLYLGAYLQQNPDIAPLLPSFSCFVEAMYQCKHPKNKMKSGSISTSEGRTVSQALSMVTSSSVSASVGNAMTENSFSTKNKALYSYVAKDKEMRSLYSLALTRQAFLTFSINDVTAPDDYLPPLFYSSGVFSVFGNRKHDDDLIMKLTGGLEGKLWYGVFAGWGNSGLYAMKKGATYVGNDTNPHTVEYFNEKIIPLLIPNSAHPLPKVRLQDSKVFDVEFEGKVDFMYDSPPYFDFEMYEGFAEQIEGISSYQQFLSDFIKPIYYNAFRYLKPGSYCVVQVESDTSFPNQNWIDAICSVGFTYKFTHLLGGGEKGTGSRTAQPLLVFQKL